MVVTCLYEAPAGAARMALMMSISLLKNFKNDIHAMSLPNLNNTWHRVTPESSIVVVFVHGYFSNARSCWTAGDGTFWPELFSTDDRLPPLSVFLGGYYTGIDSGQYGVRDCAIELLNALRLPAGESRIAPINFSNILFVCHSLGGIVTRYMLDAFKTEFQGKAIGLSLIASPSIGSDYANNFRTLISFYKNKVGRQLAFGNDFLTDLDGRFKDLITSGIFSHFSGVEAVEHKAMWFSNWLPGFKPIVLRESASRYFGNAQMLPGTDHGSIVKPTSRDSSPHKFLVGFVLTKFLSIVEPAPAFSEILSHAGPVTLPPSNRILFDAYSESCEQYYLQRDIDVVVENALSFGSLWLTGSSGTGKTAAATRALIRSDRAFTAVCLSHCDERTDRQSLVLELLVCLSKTHRSTISGSDPVADFATLTQTLRSRLEANPRFVIYLDEIPTSVPVPTVASLISQLISSTAHSTSQLSFVITSLHDLQSETTSSKFLEQVQGVRLETWNDDDLRKLIVITSRAVPDPLPADVLEEAVQLANGSPRFIKTFLRNMRLSSSRSPVRDILASTAAQFGRFS